MNLRRIWTWSSPTRPRSSLTNSSITQVRTQPSWASSAPGNLRLSPFDSTNDLWESRPLYPNIEARHDEESLDVRPKLWDAIDRNIRLHAKVTCLTQDWELPEGPMSREAFRAGHIFLFGPTTAAPTPESAFQFRPRKADPGFIRILRANPPSTVSTAPLYIGQQPWEQGHTASTSARFGGLGVDAVATAYAEAQKDNMFSESIVTGKMKLSIG